MRDTIDMAREADLIDDTFASDWYVYQLKAFEALVRADERDSWPAEMEAMERQVNILTDALATEREACAKVCDEYSATGKIEEFDRGWLACAKNTAAAIRARGNT